jgi:hypothetical protein
LRYGFQQSAAITHQIDAEFLQVLSGQAGQDAAVNLVLAKRRRILLKLQAMQPLSDVHHRYPEGSRPQRQHTPSRSDPSIAS